VALERHWIGSPNYSSRGGSAVRLIVVHTAEGALTYQALGNFFASSSAGVSSHVGIDDTPGVIGEYVARGEKAWTQANANPYSVAVELCAFAAWDGPTWAAHPQMLSNCAQWIAEEADAFGIPLERISESQAAAGAAGVLGHDDLGFAGNDHWDPGPGFPWDQVMDMARGGAPAADSPSRRKGRNMIASTDTGGGYWTATGDGAVYAFGDARYADNALGKVTGEIIGIAGKGNDGYWLFASDGGIFAFGSAGFHGRPDRT
jgi:hypothetical protein